MVFSSEKLNIYPDGPVDNLKDRPEKSLQCKTDIFNAESSDAESVKKAIIKLEEINWGEKIANDSDFTSEVMESIIKDPKNIVVILRTFVDKIIGYSIAVPDEDIVGAAYIYSTDIHPSFQGKGLIGKIMKAMEEELRKKGYEFMTRDSAVSNGYADSVERHYGDRVVEMYDHESPYGPQRYFKIKL